MTANLVAMTQPIGELSHLTPEEFITYRARVSSPQNQHKNETASRLLAYCLRHGHWSPFDMVDVTFELSTSRAIMAQILRHWSFRFQEFSQRYSAASQVEPVEIRLKHVDGNRQGSSAKQDSRHTAVARRSNSRCFDFYAEMIRDGVAPESARMVLPLATTTRAYMKGSVRSWITYFWQRLDSHAQLEHRELAGLMFDQFAIHFPVIAELTASGKMVYLSNEENSNQNTK